MPLSLRFAAVSDIGRSRKKNDDSGLRRAELRHGRRRHGRCPGRRPRLGAARPDHAPARRPGARRPARGAGRSRPPRQRPARGARSRRTPRSTGMGTTSPRFDPPCVLSTDQQPDRRRPPRRLPRLPLARRRAAPAHHDHTWVQSLIDEGRITEDEAKMHSHRSLLLKVLDGRHDNDPDLTLYDVQAGDRILLCSDGLSGFVDARPDRAGAVDRHGRERRHRARPARPRGA